MKKVLGILKKILLIILAIIVPLAFLSGVIWALDFTGLINFYKTAQKVPVVNKMLPPPEDKKPKKTPLQLENETLREDKEQLQKGLNKLKKKLAQETGDLEQKLKVKEQENKKLKAEKKSLQNTIDSLQTWKDEQEGQTLSYESLGRYYAEMKPDKAAKIMENLADEVTIGILLNLEDEQVTAILSAMEPAKAAAISDLMRQ